jgi:hypothetical protein
MYFFLYMLRATLCSASGKSIKHVDSLIFRVTYTRCTDTIESPDDEHKVARNLYRIEVITHIKGSVRQVGYLLELYRDARSPEYKRFDFR